MSDKFLTIHRMANFETALDWVLVNEGTAYVDNPADKGGPTRYGITLRTYQDYADARPQYGSRVHVTPYDVLNISMFTVRNIYRSRYWRAVNCEAIESQGTATMLFDCAVLCGPARARAIAAEAFLGVHVDTPGKALDIALKHTNIDAAERRRGQLRFVLGYQEHLIRVAMHRPQNKQFLNGWMWRADRAFHELCDAGIDIRRA